MLQCSQLAHPYSLENIQLFDDAMMIYRIQGQGGGLIKLIPKLIHFSRRPDLPDTLADPHLEEVTIAAKLGNTVAHYRRLYTHSKLLHRRISPISGSSADGGGTQLLGDLNAPSKHGRANDGRKV